jgi:hypothetical protein
LPCWLRSPTIVAVLAVELPSSCTIRTLRPPRQCVDQLEDTLNPPDPVGLTANVS